MITLVLLAFTADASIAYTVRPLQPLAQVPAAARFEPGSRGVALSLSGMAGGASVTDAADRPVHACRWTASGAVVDLGVLAGDDHSQALGGNAAGDLVGVSFELGRRSSHGVLWPIEGGMVSLGNFEAVAVNSSRAVAGTAAAQGNPPAATRAVRWVSGTTTVLPPLAGGPSARAADINDAGWVVGTSVLSDRKRSHACIWTGNGAPTDLGTLGGECSWARDIDGQVVVGVAQRADGTPVACRWTLNASGQVAAMADLGVISGAPGSGAESIGPDGAVGGSSGDSAVLFTAAGPVDLNTCIPAGTGWRLTHVEQISASGAIVGRGRLNGLPRGFVLEPAYSAGDINHDGTVNGADLGLMLASWGPCECAADLDGDGTVGGADLGLLLSQWSAP